MSFLSAITPGAGALIGGGLSLLGGIVGNQASAKQAEINRQFQADMSNTSYQRTVDDLKKAGLSPMLAYSQGGASTPSGSTASQSDVFTPAVASGRESGIARQQLDLLKAQEDESIVRARKTAIDADKTATETGRILDLLPYEIANLKAMTNSYNSSAKQANSNSRVLDQNYNINKPTEQVQEGPLGIVGAVADKIIGTVSNAVGLGNALRPKPGITVNVPKGR